MIVVDANVLAYTLIEGDMTGLAHKVREKDPDWRLPTIWRHEMTNIFTTYVRQGGLPLAHSSKILEAAVAHFKSFESELRPSEVLGFAVQHKTSAYDAQYALLAQKLGVFCVTEDRSLRKALPKLTVSMEEFCR